MTFIVILLLCPVFSIISAKDTVCHKCRGLSETRGQYCTLNNLCIGQECTFEANATGEWSAGCSNRAEQERYNATAAIQDQWCFANETNYEFTCRCTSNFCNSVTKMLEIYQSMIRKQLVLPQNMNLTCFECGMVHIGEFNQTLNISCDISHYCYGSSCLTKRGPYPHSYCGTSWSPYSDACTAKPNESEICFCEQKFCNYPYNPQPTEDVVTDIESSTTPVTLLPTTGKITAIPSPIITNTTTSDTTTKSTTSGTLDSRSSSASSDLPQTADGQKPTIPKSSTITIFTTTVSGATVSTANDLATLCPDGPLFGLNPQFLEAAKALQAMVAKLFGPSPAQKIFQNTIQRHICAYSGNPEISPPSITDSTKLAEGANNIAPKRRLQEQHVVPNSTPSPSQSAVPKATIGDAQNGTRLDLHPGNKQSEKGSYFRTTGDDSR